MAAQVAVAWGQLIGGIALAVGFLTRLAALGIAIIMGGAIATVHWPHGFSIQDHGYEYNFVLIVICVAVMLLGPGNFAVDHLKARFYLQGLEIFADQACGLECRLHEVDLCSPATQCLYANSTRSSVEIGPDRPLQPLGISRAQHVKQSFSQTVGGRANVRAWQGTQGTASVLARNHSQRLCPSVISNSQRTRSQLNLTL